MDYKGRFDHINFILYKLESFRLFFDLKVVCPYFKTEKTPTTNVFTFFAVYYKSGPWVKLRNSPDSQTVYIVNIPTFPCSNKVNKVSGTSKYYLRITLAFYRRVACSCSTLFTKLLAPSQIVYYHYHH